MTSEQVVDYPSFNFTTEDFCDDPLEVSSHLFLKSTLIGESHSGWAYYAGWSNYIYIPSVTLSRHQERTLNYYLLS